MNANSSVLDATCYTSEPLQSSQELLNRSRGSPDKARNDRRARHEEVIRVHKQMQDMQTQDFVSSRMKSFKSILKKNKALIDTVPSSIAV